MEKLKIAKELSKLPLVRIGDIQELQGNLKELTETNYNKLLARLKSKGFLYPLYLWKDKGKFYTLDGKQRHRVIEKEYGADTMLPYIEVKAANRIEAKKEILAISSDYGTVTKDGYDEFTGEFEPEDFEELENEMAFKNSEEKDEQLPYPITLVVNENEYKSWLNIKETLSEPNDFKAFMIIFKKTLNISKK
jgi:hypothetical protein